MLIERNISDAWGSTMDKEPDDTKSMMVDLSSPERREAMLAQLLPFAPEGEPPEALLTVASKMAKDGPAISHAASTRLYCVLKVRCAD